MSVQAQTLPTDAAGLPAEVPLTNGAAVPLARLPVLPYAVYRERLLAEVAAEGRVAACFAVPAGDDLELFALVARDRRGQLLPLRTRIGERFPALTPVCPQLHLFEREIAEEYGVLPEGHPWLKPVRFHAPWRGGDPWERRAAGHPLPSDMDFYRVEGEEVHEVAVGPVHAGVIEPGHFRFQCHGENVMHLEISLGYQHRDLERQLLGGPHPITPAQVEAAAGDTTIGHMAAYCQVLESLAGIEAPLRAQALRAVALELERLANHVGDIGALAGDVGFLPTASFCGRLRGDYLNLTAALCGSRFGRTLLRPGGVRFDAEPALARTLLERLAPVTRDTRGALDLFFDTPSVLARLEGVGKVPSEDAVALGLVGPAGRACGLVRDVRLQHPAGWWRERFAAAVFAESGDVFARAAVRRREIGDSLDFLRQTLPELPAGALRTPLAPLAAETLAVSLVEGWRGEIVHVALTDAAGRLRRYKIVDPSFHNWSGLAMALRQEQISDFPLCNKSFNLSYCGFDL
jgi:Ni,Fe-hydrogenase III large subunit